MTVPHLAPITEISNRDPNDRAYYSDVDMMFHGVAANPMFTRKDGSKF